MNKKTLIVHIGIGCLLATLTCLSYFNTRKQMLEAENHQLHGADLLAKVWDSNETNMNNSIYRTPNCAPYLKI